MRSSCSTKSISGALAGAGHARVRAQSSAKRSASGRRHSKQGRWPAESAVASSRKNSSVYRLGCIIAARWRPLNSKRQAIHCRVAQRRRPSVRSGRWKAPPRLPIISPRWGVTMMAPSGATRFWRGTSISHQKSGPSQLLYYLACLASGSAERGIALGMKRLDTFLEISRLPEPAVAVPLELNGDGQRCILGVVQELLGGALGDGRERA